jgi:hypothetical protein
MNDLVFFIVQVFKIGIIILATFYFKRAVK